MTALVTSKRRFTCPVCERAVDRKSRQQSFCSTKCRMKAFREKIPLGGGYSGGVTNAPKFDSKNNILEWPKTGSSVSCNGPINLLGGGSWKWPAAGKVDSKTLAKIKHSEVGGEWMPPPYGDAP
jgi:hypothetical protein